MIGPGPEPVPRRAAFWHVDGEGILCDLCPHRCRLPNGSTGLCRTRRNVSGELIALNHSKTCLSVVRPIEMAPLFHFLPGAKALFLGSFGCNLDCGDCDDGNKVRMGEDAPYRVTMPEQTAEMVDAEEAEGVVYSHGEPSLWIEHIMDAAPELRKRGRFSAIATNGSIEPWAAEDLYDLVDAVSIQMRGFDRRSFQSHCHGRLDEILEACTIAGDADCHLELCYHLMPGRNDSTKEVKAFCAWAVDELGEDTPVHFLDSSLGRPFPDATMSERTRIIELAAMAKGEGLRYVYTTGAKDGRNQDTHCPACGERVIKRVAVNEASPSLEGGPLGKFTGSPRVDMAFDGKRCPKCKEPIPIVLST